MNAYHTAGGRARASALLVLSAAVAVFAVARTVLSATSDQNSWVFVGEAGHNSNEAESYDPGDCEGVVGIPFGTDPGWVRVGGSTYPDAPFVEARGQVLQPNTGGTTKPNPFVTHTDALFNHYSLDTNTFLTLDPDFRHLLGNGNFADSFGANERGLLEVEWERGGLPMYAWPSTGDRMTVWGAHIWDCGHGDTWLGGDNEYRTEIHPPVGWVIYRNSADADQAPDNETKRTRDWIWYDSGDLQGSAAVLPATGTLNTPIQATIADAFFSSFGGNVPEALNGCDADFEDCHQDNEWRQSLLQQDYTFFVPAPVRPGGDPVLVWESEDRCGEVPHSPGNPPGDDIDDIGEAGDTAENIGAPTCNISDTVTTGVDENGHPGIWVTVNATAASYPANDYVAFAKRYKVSWDFIPAATERARTVKVTFNTLRVYDDSEPCGEDGEWVLSLRANEAWIHPVAGHGDSDTPFWSDGAVDDALCGGDGDYKDYAINESVTINVRHGQPVVFFSRGFDVDVLANDILPYLLESQPGAGSYVSALASGADGGEYKILYTITDLTPAVPTAGTLVIGNPKYGPNADTGGSATRVSKVTPIELTGSDATRLEYRYWKAGDAKPATWSFDNNSADGLKVDLTGVTPDDRYTIEYAPVSSDGIVGERRSVQIELDSTPPTVTVPANFSVDATSAAGTTVEYTASAVDSLPGPVTFACVPASGSFFLIKNVTTVTCTASDAVGNVSSKSFTIEVLSPFGYIPDFVVLAHQWTNVGNAVAVQSGNVGAFDGSVGAPGSPGYEVVIGPSATLTGGPKVAAQTVRLLSNTHAGNVYSVGPVQAGTGATYTQKSGYVPLFLGMPNVPAFSAGGPNQTFSNTAVLGPGTYGKLKLSPNAEVTLTGGDYYFTSIDLGANSQLLFAAATDIHVTGRVELGNSAKVLPAAGSGVLARQIVFWVTGVDGPPGGTTAFTTANGVQMEMNVYARNGTLTIGPSNIAKGAFLGLRVNVLNNTTLNLDSAFDYPYP